MGFKERLNEERDELKDKVTKLSEFMLLPNSSGLVGEYQYEMLTLQLLAMNAYLTILNNRLKAL